MINRNVIFLCLFFSLLSGLVVAADTEEFESEEQKVFYFLGAALSSNIQSLNLTSAELALVQRGLSDSVQGKAIELDQNVYGPKLQEMAQNRVAASASDEVSASSDYVKAMAAEDGAVTTDSGIVMRELVSGSGSSPTPDSTVKAHYHGTLRDGSVFDSSVSRGQPFTSSLSSVIPCWREAIPTMKEGGKSKITCPAELAYGNNGSGPIPGGAALTFEVELIEVVN